MMRIRNPQYISLISLLIMAFLTFSCEEEDQGNEALEQENRFFELYMGATFKDTIAPPKASGLYYIEVREGSGQALQDGDWVLANYVTYAIPEDNVLDSYIENVIVDNSLVDTSSVNILTGPVKILLGGHIEGINEGLSYMKAGGQAIFCFTSDLGYGAKGGTLMKNVSNYQSLRHEIEIVDYIGDIEAWEEERFGAYVESIEGALPIWDSVSNTTMYYVIDQAYPDSAQVVFDTTVFVDYKGYLFDERVFDTTEGGDPFELDFQEDAQVIRGWILGLQKFREGEKGRLIIPWALAYGEDGDYRNGVWAIPPYENLVFDIEISGLGEDNGIREDQ